MFNRKSKSVSGKIALISAVIRSWQSFRAESRTAVVIFQAASQRNFPRDGLALLVEHAPMQIADMMSAAPNHRPLRRVVWRYLRSTTRLEFCEATSTNSQITLTGTLLDDAGSVPAYVSYELTCSGDLARCTSLRLECVVREIRSTLTLEREPTGRWLQNGAYRPELDQCTDPDLQWSPATNAFPIRRLAEIPHDSLKIKAAWVRFPTLSVQPVAQSYTRLSATRYRYRNEDSGYEGHIDVDELGLPTSYEGVWTRTADWRAP